MVIFKGDKKMLSQIIKSKCRNYYIPTRIYLLLAILLLSLCACKPPKSIDTFAPRKPAVSMALKKISIKKISSENIFLQARVVIENKSKIKFKYKIQEAYIYHQDVKIGEVSPSKEFEPLNALVQQEKIVEVVLSRAKVISAFLQASLSNQKQMIELRGVVIAKSGIFTVKEDFSFQQEINIADFLQL